MSAASHCRSTGWIVGVQNRTGPRTTREPRLIDPEIDRIAVDSVPAAVAPIPRSPGGGAGAAVPEMPSIATPKDEPIAWLRVIRSATSAAVRHTWRVCPRGGVAGAGVRVGAVGRDEMGGG